MNIRWGLRCLVLMPALLGLACSEDSVGPNDNGGDNPWLLGETSTYDIAGDFSQSVVDQTTGLEFRFPDGGEGQLSISEVTSGPTPPYEGTGFAVTFTGIAPIEIIADRADGEEIMVMAYGSAPGCYDDELAANDRWLAIPVTDSSNDRLTFLLDVTTDGTALSKIGARTFTYHWMSRISASSPDMDKMRAIRWQSSDFVDQCIDDLPVAHKTRVRGEVDGRLKVRYQWDGLYYSGFWRRSLGSLGRAVVPTLHFRVNTTAGSVAHETGHYIVHALVGDDVQSTLEGQGNIYFDHEIGDNNERAKLLEEYAYFMEYYFTNSVATYNPEHPYTIWGGLEMSPLNYDLPAHEGFGLLMLSALTRTGNSVQSLANPSVNLPIPEIARPFSDAFGIIAQGATDVHGLLTNVQSALTAEEKTKYQVIMQRSGWQYSITGVLVDKNGDPVPDVTVRNVLTAGGTRYVGGVSYVPTGTDGKFTITGEVFPGQSTLQCVKGTDTTYVDIDINWHLPTNQKINLGSLTVDFDNILAQLQSRTRISVDVYGEHYSNYGIMYNDTEFRPNAFSNMTWNGTQFSAVDTTRGASYTYERYISGTVSANGRRILTLTYTYKYRESNSPPRNGIIRAETDTEIVITNMDFTDDYYGSLRFRKEGPEAGSFVALSHHRLVEYEDEELGTTVKDYTHTNWNSSTVTPFVAVYF